MSMTSVLNIAISGLNAAVSRVANAASNIVNASSTATFPKNASSYTGFTPQDVISLSDQANLGVTTTAVPRTPAYVPVSDPLSPQANSDGLVASPNVDLAGEIISSNVASVNYGANAAVIKIANKMEKSLLDVIK
jgi:flagellar basal-body rod protein FlgC